MNNLTYGNLLSAWKGINEYLFLECEDIVKKGGGEYGSAFVSYDNYVKINRAWVDPEFDFGKVLGYSIKKWTSLLNNYVDMKYVDLLRNTIGYRVGKVAKSYNYSFHFSNHHGGGKDCLVSLTFQKRLKIEQPVVIFNIRTSEVTKRLLFDFLLVQRIIEYVYGHNDVEVRLFAPSFFISMESILMYNNVTPLKKLLKRHKAEKGDEYKGENHNFQRKTMEMFEKYYNHPDPMSVNFKVHRRSILQIQKDENGEPRSGVPSLFAKELLLNREVMDVPEGTLTRRQFNKIRKDKKLKKKHESISVS